MAVGVIVTGPSWSRQRSATHPLVPPRSPRQARPLWGGGHGSAARSTLPSRLRKLIEDHEERDERVGQTIVQHRAQRVGVNVPHEVRDQKLGACVWFLDDGDAALTHRAR